MELDRLDWSGATGHRDLWHVSSVQTSWSFHLFNSVALTTASADEFVHGATKSPCYLLSLGATEMHNAQTVFGSRCCNWVIQNARPSRSTAVPKQKPGPDRSLIFALTRHSKGL
jgi:hypothetical protein